MSFGKNPHVAKAQAAEQKADEAADAMARTAAYREAAHQWDRAAAREQPGKKRGEYEQHAARNRERADGEHEPAHEDAAKAAAEDAADVVATPVRLLN